MGSIANAGATASIPKKGGVVGVVAREDSFKVIVAEVNEGDDSAAAFSIPVDPGSAEPIDAGEGAVSFAADSSSTEEPEGAVSIGLSSRGLSIGLGVATIIAVGATSSLAVARAVPTEEP